MKRLAVLGLALACGPEAVAPSEATSTVAEMESTATTSNADDGSPTSRGTQATGSGDEPTSAGPGPASDVTTGGGADADEGMSATMAVGDTSSTGVGDGPGTTTGEPPAPDVELCVKPMSDYTPVPFALEGTIDASGVAIGDLDGDGTADVLVADPTNARILARLGDGAGDFAASTDLLVPGVVPQRLAAGFVDADPELDLVTTDLDRLVVLPDAWGGGGGSSTIDLPGQPADVDLLDADADGDLDLVTLIDPGNDSARLLRGNGNGSFSPALEIFIQASPHAIGVGDLDGDGLVDGAGFSTNQAGVLLRQQLPEGGFDNAGALTYGPLSTGAKMADWTGTVALDLVSVAGSGGVGHLQVWVGGGGFSFPGSASYVFAAELRELAVVPDGLRPLVVGTSDAELLLVYENAGEPCFDALALDGPLRDIALADLDGDAAIDIAVVDGPTLWVLLSGA